MAEQDDIFGKIDALVEKRAGFGLGAKVGQDDFPVLTEVVEEAQDKGVRIERRQVERRLGDRRQRSLVDATSNTGTNSASIEQIMQRLERKLEDLFIRQQMRLEESVRQAVRKELVRLQKEETDKS
ncbi:MAG: hypothetical protein N2Z63_01415 [Thiobacillaceae bacterium]|nr:hypothetical protein [Thiobacillaceae bacterium]